MGEVDEVDLLLGLQWVFDNKEDYNIKSCKFIGFINH